MKYIKLYENINFEDISEEEFEFSNIKSGDILLKNQDITFWNKKWINTHISYNYIIDKIELSDNITCNPYNDYNDEFQKIPDGEIMLSIKGIWPWFRYDKNIKIK